MKVLKLFFIWILLLQLIDNQVLIAQTERPKLVVGIVIDQMRVDYLYRFNDKYGEGGFKRLLKQGFHCKNAQYNYVPTETAPGHASVYTGTTPAYHGIVANEWFENGKKMYCVSDSTEKGVGSKIGTGNISPRNLLATTITDQLRIATNFKSKVYGISIKDRGAVLPAGHAANGAFWYDGGTGKFISSTYYYQELPTWVQKFNERKLAEKYLKETWNTLLPIEKYTESTADDTPYEQLLAGKTKPVFPYNLKEIGEQMSKAQIKRSAFELLPITPYGNTIVKELAIATLIDEKLGKGQFTDFLAVSFSSTDIIGHTFGTNSIEIQDTYLRLDKDLEEFFEMLDREVGEDNYLVFLTADHAGANNPKFLTDNKLPGGYMSIRNCVQSLETYLNSVYGQDAWVSYSSDKEIYLNRRLIAQKKLDLAEFQTTVAKYMRDCEGIFDAFTGENLETQEYTSGIRQFVQAGYYYRRSPDVTLVHKPGWLDNYWNKGGTTHGTPFGYDTHVPILFYGWKIPKGKTTIRHVAITDIAPTLTVLLNVQMPSFNTGAPIREIFE
ncbi:MAG: alkaline phosphatase family protein [Microscillaceae bacterium]|jgi:predicted AlkP superfamily phosphohydrolase/phosphomutase|nr:alkaline phosphatase family protein [Microscillaceae bacterium]